MEGWRSRELGPVCFNVFMLLVCVVGRSGGGSDDDEEEEERLFFLLMVMGRSGSNKGCLAGLWS